MQSRTRDSITYVVVVGAALLLILYSLGFFSRVAGEFPITGEVVAVENVGAGAKEALVQLAPGKIVRAAIPPACIVFPGQTATLSSFAHPFSTEPEYRVLSTKEKNDT